MIRWNQFWQFRLKVSTDIFNIFAPNLRTFEKIFLFRKNFHSIKFSYRNVKFRFDRDVEIYSRKCEGFVRYGPKIFRRPILSEKKSSKSSWNDLESKVVNGGLIFWTKNQKPLFKVPKFFLKQKQIQKTLSSNICSGP